MPATKKFTPEIDAKLYKEFVALAKRNGQSQRHILEEALKFYLKMWVPSQHLGPPRGDGCLRAIGGQQTVTCSSVSPSKCRIT